MKMKMKLVILLLAICYASVDDLVNSDEAAMAEAAAGEASLAGISNLARINLLGGVTYTEITVEHLGDFDMLFDWLLSIVSLCLYGAVPAILLGAIMPIWCLCRVTGGCKCCPCCIGHPREHWSFRQKACPCFLQFICFCVILAMALVSFLATGTYIDSIIADDTGLYDIIAEDVFGGTVDFLTDVESEVDVIYNASASGGDIDTYASWLNTTHADTIALGNDNITDHIQAYCNDWTDHTIVVTDGTSYLMNVTSYMNYTICPYMILEVDTYSQYVWDTFQDTLDSVVDTMLEASASIHTMVGSVKDDMLTPAGDTVNNLYDSIVTARVSVANILTLVEYIYIGLLFLPIIPSLLVVLSYCCKSPCCFTFSYTIAWLLSMLCFALLAIHVPIAGGFMDWCEMLSDLEEDFEGGLEPLGLDNVGALMDGCMNGTSLAVTFNLTDQLSFGSAVSFPDFDVTPYFEYDLWENHASNMTALNYYEAYNASLYSCENIAYTTSCQDLDNEFDALVSDIELVDDVINNTLYDAQEIMDDMAAVETVFDPIIESADDIVDLMSCAYIGGAYLDFKTMMCGDFLASLGTICAAFLVNALFVFFVTVITCRTRKQFVEYNPDNAQGIEMGNVQVQNNGQIL